MPFKSIAQRRYLWLKHPDIARRWTKEHGSKIVPSKKKKLSEWIDEAFINKAFMNKWKKDLGIKDGKHEEPIQKPDTRRQDYETICIS